MDGAASLDRESPVRGDRAASDTNPSDRTLPDTVLSALFGTTPGVLAMPRWLPNENRFADQDADMLPDSVEHVLLLDQSVDDSDDDGVHDFLHAAAGYYASIDGSPTAGIPPTDHLMRVVNTVEDDPQGAAVWTHLLLRVVGGDLQEIHALDLYLDHWGQRVSLLPLIQTGPVDVELSRRASGDLWVRVSVRLMSEQELLPLTPCTIAVNSVMGQRQVGSGGYVQFIDGASCAMVAAGPDTGLLQTLRKPRLDDPFWTTNRICVLRLLVVGTTSGGVYAEVSRADCVVGRTTTACPPTCTTSVGRLVFFPDGMRTVTGGGD